jgi:hypothetical protein
MQRRKDFARGAREIQKAKFKGSKSKINPINILIALRSSPHHLKPTS